MVNKRKIFLLGGRDLEMLEIKNILDAEGEDNYDKELSWGAKLSDYSPILDKYSDHREIQLVGIELYNDVTNPSNYLDIDHHGDNAYKKSSLEQVAELLKLNLSPYHSFVAANDSGHIAGMYKQIGRAHV